MMMRPNSFVLHICIISIFFNCSTCADQVIFAHANMNSETVDSVVPMNDLYIINDVKKTENVSGNGTLFDDEQNVNYAQKESSQRLEDDLVLLPNSSGYNRYENSKIQSIVESSRYERAAESQDLCDTSECKCTHESKFLTVDCHFQQVSFISFKTNFHGIFF